MSIVMIIDGRNPDCDSQIRVVYMARFDGTAHCCCCVAQWVGIAIDAADSPDRNRVVAVAAADEVASVRGCSSHVDSQTHVDR